MAENDIETITITDTDDEEMFPSNLLKIEAMKKQLKDLLKNKNEERLVNDKHMFPFEILKVEHCEELSAAETKRGESEIAQNDVLDLHEETLCKHCNLAFKTSAEYEQHIKRAVDHPKTSNKVNIYRCKLCSCRFLERAVFQKHLKRHEEKQQCDNHRFACALCDKTYKTEAWLVLHINRYHWKEISNRSHHRKLSSKHPSWEKDIKITVHDSAPKQDNEQMSTLEEDTSQLDRNNPTVKLESEDDSLKQQSEFLPFVCAVCKEAFQEEAMLMLHIKDSHSDEKDVGLASENDCSKPELKSGPYGCEICKISFYYENGLQSHMKRYHWNEKDVYEKPWEQLKAQKPSYKFDKNLMCYVKSEETRLEFPKVQSLLRCSQCPATFVCKHHYSQHTKAHEEHAGDRQVYVCQLCKATFLNSDNLDFHMKTKHPCTSCNLSTNEFST